MTIGARKRFSQGFQLEGNYVLSEDLDDDSNERDPFTSVTSIASTFARTTHFPTGIAATSLISTLYTKLPAGFEFSGRIQAHTAQPITDNPWATVPALPVAHPTLSREW